MRASTVIAATLVAAGATPSWAQWGTAGTPDRCTPAPDTGVAALLRQAAHALGADGLGDGVLHLRMTEATVQDYQSDRSYPPFFLAFTSRESWYRPATGVTRTRGRMTFPGGDFELPELLSGTAATFLAGDTARPLPPAHAAALVLRGLDPWATVHDWSGGGAVRLVGRCVRRDYPRTVLERTGPYGRERLALDRRTGLPISLEREEPHYLWGQISVAYVYSNWKRTSGISVPGSSFRMVDGAAEVSRTLAFSELVPDDSAPTAALPPAPDTMLPGPPGFLAPTAPDSVRVSPSTRLLVNPGYTHGVVLLSDTLYLLDATQGEARARADSALIDRLFPGPHPIVLVVTDLAWPHIAGVRYWVARGATIVSHRASRDFLERVLQRRWTRSPDLYERRRRTARLAFRAVDDSLSLAGGKLRLYAIDGIGSEGGLMAYVDGDRFLWAGDYIQSVTEPSTYATEVWTAVQRAGVRPVRTAAQHLPLTEWTTVDSLARSDRTHEPT